MRTTPSPGADIGDSQGRRIVLYCQRAGCKFAERVGVKLIDDGFTNLTIFKGGWMEWTAKYGTPDPNENERKDEQPKN